MVLIIKLNLPCFSHSYFRAYLQTAVQLKDTFTKSKKLSEEHIIRIHIFILLIYIYDLYGIQIKNLTLSPIAALVVVFVYVIPRDEEVGFSVTFWALLKKSGCSTILMSSFKNSTSPLNICFLVGSSIFRLQMLVSQNVFWLIFWTLLIFEDTNAELETRQKYSP